MQLKLPHNKLVLVILDGWGEASIDALSNPKINQYNAIYQAKTPFIDSIKDFCAKSLIYASADEVGLPQHQMGNSEVGHLNLGAGRVVNQDIVRINKAIKSGEFNNNQTLQDSFTQLAKSNRTLHIIGLCSDGGVHSHQDHMLALFELACQKSIKRIYFHLILDGRDVPPQSAEKSIDLIETICKSAKKGKIASIIGRYYAMDRDSRWQRIEKAYKLYAEGKTELEYYYKDAKSALFTAYGRSENDEFIKASVIGNYKGINDDDCVIFMNFRADRARELTRSFIDLNFAKFKKKQLQLQDFISLTQYQDSFNNKVVFKPKILNNTLAEVLSCNNKKQLRLAETEKYAHVTYFFSGGREELFDGEKRELIASPKVSTYDLKPEMSALELNTKLIKNINSNEFDFIVCNFANPDMVGHTGNLKATIKAIEVIDTLLCQLAKTCQNQKYQLLITADHGNAEKMFDPKTNQAHTAHTLNPVPLYYLGKKSIRFKKSGKLSNIAPTILELMKLEKVKEMTESSLVINKNQKV